MTSQLIRATVGKLAPAFRTQAWDFRKGTAREISLEDYKNKYLLLFFYPLDFTYVCPTEILEFSQKASKFRNVNCEVLGCSIDSHFSHEQWTKQPRDKGGLGEIEIPLLADVTKKVAESYGVLNDAGVALRGTFIIDNENILKHSSITDNSVGRNVDEYLRLVQAFQHVQKNGEVCPAQWQPGQRAMPGEAGEKLDKYWEEVYSKKK